MSNSASRMPGSMQPPHDFRLATSPANGHRRARSWTGRPKPSPGITNRSESVLASRARAPNVVGWLRFAAARCRVIGQLAIHLPAFAAAYLMAYTIHFDGTVPLSVLEKAIASLPLVLSLKSAAFVAMKCHRGWFRRATFADVVTLAEAITLGSVALTAVNQFLTARAGIPCSVLIMDWAGTLLLLCGTRGLRRLIHERHYFAASSNRRAERALVVSAAEAGEALIRMIHTQPDLSLKVVGVLDPDRATHGRVLAGVEVLGSPEDAGRHAARHQAQLILIPTPAVSAREVRALVTACHEAGLKARVVPGFDALLTGDLTVQPRDVDIHDLLCREPVRLDGESVGRFLRGRIVLVTGAAGSIGSEICRQILAFRPGRLILLDHNENGLFFAERELRDRAAGAELVPCVASVTDSARLRSTFNQHRPGVVFHAAAHKHVPMMEANPGEAIKNNVFGTRTLVEEALQAGVDAFVMISTDKAVNPTSVMGACKRLAEMYVHALSGQAEARLVTVRFGNVLGSNGSVVPLFKEQIRRGGPVTVTHPDMIRYFMTIPEAAQLVLQAGTLGSGGEIFVLDMGEPVKIVDLARDLIRLSGFEVGREIDIAFSGLRPGEKLYEELYDQHEQGLPTPHPKIFLARHSPCSIHQLRTQLDHLAQIVDQPIDQVLAALAAIVPGYRPRALEDEEPAAARLVSAKDYCDKSRGGAAVLQRDCFGNLIC